MTLEQLTVLATIAGVIIAFFQFIGPLISPLWTLIAAKRRRYRKALRRAVRYVGLLWILLVTACCWWVWITNKSDGRLTNAQRLVLAAHDEAVSAYGAASEQYRKVLDSEKNCVLAHLGMGRIDFYTGLYTEAEHEYQQVLDVDPQNLDALQALALDQSDAKFSEYPQAIRTLNSLLSVDPHYSKGQYLLGLNYLRAWKARGDWDDTGPSDYFELAKNQNLTCVANFGEDADLAQYNLACLYALRSKGAGVDAQQLTDKAVEQLQSALDMARALDKIHDRQTHDYDRMVTLIAPTPKGDEDLSQLWKFQGAKMEVLQKKAENVGQ